MHRRPTGGRRVGEVERLANNWAMGKHHPMNRPGAENYSFSSASLRWPCLHSLTHNPILQHEPRPHSELHGAEPGTEPASANQRRTQSLASNQKQA